MAAPGLDGIVGEGAKLDLITHGLVFGEGPVWDRRKGRLIFTEIIGDTIWEFVPGVGARHLMHPSSHANGTTFDQQGRLLVAG